MCARASTAACMPGQPYASHEEGFVSPSPSTQASSNSTISATTQSGLQHVRPPISASGAPPPAAPFSRPAVPAGRHAWPAYIGALLLLTRLGSCGAGETGAPRQRPWRPVFLRMALRPGTSLTPVLQALAHLATRSATTTPTAVLMRPRQVDQKQMVMIRGGKGPKNVVE
jgi:hypothetical protein